MQNTTVYLLAVILLTACASTPPSPTPISPEEVQQTAIAFAWTSVAASFSPTPSITPTVAITRTPRPTFTPSNTPEPTIIPQLAPKTDGFYLVYEDIVPGIWRSNGQGDACYWEVTTETGEIMSNHFGMAGGTMFIPAEAFQVRLEDCGTWELITTSN